jgi:hypothetical protein
LPARGSIIARSFAAREEPDKGERLMNLDTVAERVRAEFEEMPGMTLTVRQASRLFGLEPDLCLNVVERLIGSAYLRWTRTGLVARSDR